MSTGGEVANALVCKTSIRRFNSGPVLQNYRFRGSDRSQVGTELSKLADWSILLG
jgi:hypothetical protein